MGRGKKAPDGKDVLFKRLYGVKPDTFEKKRRLETRKGLQRYPFLPQAKKIQAESPVSGAERRKCAQNR
jgi:hypothetical protein